MITIQQVLLHKSQTFPHRFWDFIDPLAEFFFSYRNSISASAMMAAKKSEKEARQY